MKTSKLPLILIVAIAVLTPLLSTAMFYLWQPAANTHKGEVIDTQNPTILPPPSWQTIGGEVAGGGNDDNGNSGEEGGRNDSGGNGEEWRGKWTLLQTTPAAVCDEQCRRRLCQMRQLRLMLPGNYLRLRRVWLINDNGGGNINPDDETGGSITIGGEIDKTITANSDCGEIDTAAAAAARRRATEVDILQGVARMRGDSEVLPTAAADLRREDYLYIIDPAGRIAMRFSPTLTIYEIRADLSRLLKLSKGWRQAK